VGEGVPLLDQALGKQKESKVLVMTHGKWDVFCIVVVVAI
jgi:hypothetical protein